MPAYIYGVLAAGWLTWVAPFFLIKRGGGAPQALDRRARWGIILEGVAYAVLWQNSFWTRSPPPWRIAFGVLFMVIAGALSWTSARTLGRQWRFELAIAIFMIGTEIRVRIEDALLASRFGDEFHAYQRTVPAYVPLLR